MRLTPRQLQTTPPPPPRSQWLGVWALRIPKTPSVRPSVVVVVGLGGVGVGVVVVGRADGRTDGRADGRGLGGPRGPYT